MAYDAFVAVCVLLGLVLGFWKGLTLQLAGILALVLGFALGIPLTQAILSALPETPPLHGLFIFLGSFALIALVCHLVAIVIRRRLEERELGGWDRQMGALSGVVHGLLLCLMLSFALVVVAPSMREPILERSTGRVMARAFRAIRALLPEGVREGMEPLVERARGE